MSSRNAPKEPKHSSSTTKVCTAVSQLAALWMCTSKPQLHALSRHPFKHRLPQLSKLGRNRIRGWQRVCALLSALQRARRRPRPRNGPISLRQDLAAVLRSNGNLKTVQAVLGDLRGCLPAAQAGRGKSRRRMLFRRRRSLRMSYRRSWVRNQIFDGMFDRMFD